MGISERKERDKEEMKKLITMAAMNMFLEDGYAKTSIRNIADAIEYSPGTIYLYYKDKDELLYEVQHQAFLKLIEAFKVHAASADPLTRLVQLGKTYLSFGLENPELYDLMFIIRAPMNVDQECHKDNSDECFGYVLACLKECMAKDLLIFEDPLQAALQVWSMMHGLVSLHIRGRLKIMLVEDDLLASMLNKAVDEYIASIIK